MAKKEKSQRRVEHEEDRTKHQQKEAKYHDLQKPGLPP